MADMEVAEQPATPPPEAEQRCSVRMSYYEPCGRPIHAAPSSVDEEPVCLMHSRDPNKSDAAFQEEFERILKDAGEGDADFSRFVFPSAPYSQREFKAKCKFYSATFTQGADFWWARFTQDADFSKATFTGEVHFENAAFQKSAYFSDATFQGSVFFRETKFREDEEHLPGPIFSLARFERPELVLFYQTYLGQALFHNCDVTKFNF